MTRLYLIRHAEAEGNLYRIAQGHYDSLITELGYRQIAALRERFRDVHVDAVYSSDLFRTRTTARAIYEPKGLPLHTEPAFREIGMGVWEGKCWQELAMTQGDLLHRFNCDMGNWQVEGSETLQTVLDRFIPALERVAKENDGKTVAVVAHGMALRMVLGTLQGMTMEELNRTHHADNTAVSLVEYEDGRFRVIFRDDNSHLAGTDLSTFARQSWWRNKQGREVGVYYGPMTEEARQELTDGGARVPEGGEQIAVRFDQRTIGGVQLLPEGEIGWYYLLPAWRGKRLGVPPLGQVVYRCRGQGLEYVRLHCGDEQLRPFFSKLGFVLTQGDGMALYIGYKERATI